MKVKNYLSILLLFIVLICCMNNISAINDDNMNIASEIDSGDDSISVSNDEISLDNTQVLNAQNSDDENKDTSILGDDESESAEDDTDDNSTGEDEDYSDLKDEEFSFMDDIKESTTGDYYRFVNYLIND